MLKIITIITKFIVAALLALSLFSCGNSFSITPGIKGSGNIVNETRTVTQDFKKIKVSTGIKVVVEQGPDRSIVVEADDNIMQHIVTKVENNVLIIKSDESYNATKTPVVNVKLPIINGLNASSGSQILSTRILKSENIAIIASSGSQINIEVESDMITLESSSGSSIESSGKALKLETSASSGSEIDAKDLMANEVISQSSSGSSTSVYPILKLDAKANSGSSVSYYKVPKTLIKDESSGGSVSEN
jgi:Putative auto-transporter adhesin, head GIN domain